MDYSKIGVTGFSPKISQELVTRGCKQIECSINNPSDFFHILKESGVDYLIHAAECNGIDYCEDKANESIVIKTNTRGTYNVVNACARLGIRMVYISSSYVFDGKKWFGSYKETDRPKPNTFYGMTKLAGEAVCNFTDDKIKVVRTAEYTRPQHLADGLLYFIENFDRMPKLLNIAADQGSSWRRLQSGGLDVSKARKLGVPIYSVDMQE